jgi:hypothetical protein
MKHLFFLFIGIVFAFAFTFALKTQSNANEVAPVGQGNVAAGLKMTEYSFVSPAKIDQGGDRITFTKHMGGNFCISHADGISGLRINLEYESSDKKMTPIDFWVVADGVKYNQPITKFQQLLELHFSPAASVKLAMEIPLTGSITLEKAVVITGKGALIPLLSAFQPGYEKLPTSGARIATSFDEPPTQQLSATVAKSLVEADWLEQRGSVSLEKACSEELTRCERILKRQSKPLDGLSAFRGKPSTEALYLKIRRFKRNLMMSDPQIDFSQVLCIDNPYTHGSGDQQHEVRVRNEDAATMGGRMLLLEGLNPDAKVRKLAPNGSRAAFWRPDLSFDGKKVLFCMKKEDEPAYHIYEVALDGTGFRQITRGDYNDLDPIYAPDGSFIFSTTRVNTFLRCGGNAYRMFVLARMDAEGKNIYFISTNAEADFTPVFLADGRILYTRWEYVDKEVIRIQSLWTVNPDGTALNAFWGNQSRWPDMQFNARVIPGSNKVLFQAAGHHFIYDGGLGVIDQSEGMNYPDGVYNLTPDVPWGEVGKGPADKAYNMEFTAPSCYKAFNTPYPFSKDLMLVSARKGFGYKLSYESDKQYFNLYLMDYDGNMELLYDGAFNILHAMPVRKREIPRQMPSKVEWPGEMKQADQQPKPGIFYSQDVYEGTKIPHGLAKSLRILEILPQTFSDGKRTTGTEACLYSDKGAFPKMPLFGETAISFLMDDTPKRILGTVPIEQAGSVHFEVPSMRSLYFQLLDENGRCLHTMRSFTHAMPGEVRGCVGCHETRPVAPAPKPSLAMRRVPSKITALPWGDATISFPRFVQPVLNKHCISCHGGATPKGGFDFTHRTEPGTLLSWPYVKLVFGDNPKDYEEMKKKSIAGPIFPYAIYQNPEVKFSTQNTVVPPMTAMSYRSKLIQIATSGKHHDVKVSPLEASQLIAWVDALCPYQGLEEMLEIPDKTGYTGALTYPPLMRTMPAVHRAFKQDAFESQKDRLPTDESGKVLPSIYFENGKQLFRIPTRKEKK